MPIFRDLLRPELFENKMNKYNIIKPDDVGHKGYYKNQYYHPNPKIADELGHVHFETAEDMERFKAAILEEEYIHPNKLTMSTFDYWVFILSLGIIVTIVIMGISYLIERFLR